MNDKTPADFWPVLIFIVLVSLIVGGFFGAAVSGQPKGSRYIPMGHE